MPSRACCAHPVQQRQKRERDRWSGIRDGRSIEVSNEMATQPLPEASFLHGRAMDRRCGTADDSSDRSDTERPNKLRVDELVLSHLGLAIALAARYRHRGETTDDLNQVAFVGLVNAAQRFDPTRGTAFSTFATRTVLGELRRHFRDS